MSVFNSLGSNYNFIFSVKVLFERNYKDKRDMLESFLEEKYRGKVKFFYKGRDCLTILLRNLNLPKNSFVAINGFTCFALYQAIRNAGQNAWYLDINKSLNFTAYSFEKAVSVNPKIKAVIIQNTLGYPAEIEKIKKVCSRNKIILIEDLAHSVGSLYENGKEAGTIGDYVIFSFSQDKIIDAVAGGALIARNGDFSGFADYRPADIGISRELLDRLYPIFTYLIRKTYSFEIGRILHAVLSYAGFLVRPMDSILNYPHALPLWNSSLIINRFENLGENLNHRRNIARIYSRNLRKSFLLKPIVRNINKSSNLRFPIFVKNRKSLIDYFSGNGIHVSDVWYDAPISPKRFMTQTNYNGQCKNSEKICEEILNLPTHENVSKNQAMRIVNLINKWGN